MADDAAKLVKELAIFADTVLFDVTLVPEEIDGYDMEYYVVLDEDMNI